jgi:hypothetical protein
MLKKVIFLLNDIVLTDDQISAISGEQNLVKEAIIADEVLFKKLQDILMESELDNVQTLDVREYILPILDLLIKFNPELLETLKPMLEQYQARINKFLEEYTVDSDWQELLTKEIEKAQDIITPKPAVQEEIPPTIEEPAA